MEKQIDFKISATTSKLTLMVCPMNVNFVIKLLELKKLKFLTKGTVSIIRILNKPVYNSVAK